MTAPDARLDSSGASDRAGLNLGVVVRGTDDPVDIAAVIAVLGAMSGEPAQPTGYERWRLQRLAALKRSRRASASRGR